MALGSVSVPTFTRAEIDTMLKKAMYSDGEVVWSGTVLLNSSVAGASVSVPDTVDYVIIKGQKLARGGSCAVSDTGYNEFYKRSATLTATVALDADGTLAPSKATAHENGTTSSNYQYTCRVTCTGYRYY